MTRRGVATLLEILSALTLVLALGGCDLYQSWFGDEDKKPKLKGERIPVLVAEQNIKPDPQVQDLAVELPSAQTNPDWPQSGGNPAHDMQNVSVGNSLNQVWSSSIGEGRSKQANHLAVPVIGGGRIFAMDTTSIVRAFDLDRGTSIWQTDAKPDADDIGDGDVGGGLAYADGQLFVTNNFGEVLALDANSGAIKWRRSLAGPTRAAPTVGGGRAFVVTADNQLNVLDVKDGRVQWTHAGLSEVTGLLGAASPAFDGDIVVVPYTSGELYALRADNGRVLWSDTLASVRRVDAISALADIRANPVIDRDRVVAVGNSGRMVSIDLRSGGRAWEDPIGGWTMPWVAGDFVFVLSNENQLICVTRRDGRVRWLVQLDRWKDTEKKKDPILWVGPVLIGDKLVTAGSDERLITISPQDGTILNTIELGDPVSIPPVVANGTLFVLTDAGDLRAFR